MKNVAIYCRVSSDDQKERETIENQVEILESYVEIRENLKIIKKYLDDGISGTIPFEERPEGKELLKDSTSGLFNTVLVYRVDRFGRDTLTGLSTIEKLRNNNIEILSVTEPFDLNTPTGRYQFINYLNMAELERNNILDRMFIGATRAAKKGQWLGGITPYGYRVENKYLVVDEEEAKVVKKIYDLYTEDKLSTLDIAIYLNNNGIKSSCGEGKGKRTKNITGMWRSSSVQRILSSKTYCGLHEYGKRASRRKETILREVPAIVTKEQWDKAQAQKEANKIFNTRNMKTRVFLLRGLLECTECKNKYYGVNYGERGAYYVCSGKRGEKKKIDGIKCTNANIPADEAETLALDACLEFLNNLDEFIDNFKSINDTDKISELESEISVLVSSKKNKTNEKSNIISLYRKNIITEEDLTIQLNEINKENDNLDKIINLKKNTLATLNKKNDVVDNATAKLKHYKSRLNNLSIEDKLDIINIFIDKIEVSTAIVNGKKEPVLNTYFNFFKLNAYKDNRVINKFENQKETLGLKLKTLRCINNTTLSELSREFNLSYKTLKNAEENYNSKFIYYYCHLYSQKFNVDKIKYFNLYEMKELTNIDKIAKIKAYLGLKTDFQLCDILEINISTLLRIKKSNRSYLKLNNLLCKIKSNVNK